MKKNAIGIVIGCSIACILIIVSSCPLSQAQPIYSVSFDSQDATVDAIPTNKKVESPATTIDVLPVAPTKEGYIFGGWYTATDGGGSEFTASTVVTEDITVYAKWNTYSYAVTFDSQDATVDAIPTSKTVESPATTIDVLPTEPTKEGYDFEGWFTTTDGGGSEFTASTVVTEDIPVYAKWNGNLTIGDIGPSRGYVFYDKEEYTDGWRYLEAAPAGWGVTAEDPRYIFGFYRDSLDGTNTLVGTETAIGSGVTNTEALIGEMGPTAYKSNVGFERALYAAKVCADYRGGWYANWFLPSKDELNLMYENLKTNNLGGFSDDYYWSSSEDDGFFAHSQVFYKGGQYGYNRSNELRVRPVRAF